MVYPDLFYLEHQITLIFEPYNINYMARTSTYLNFAGNTEAAFNFYRSVFGGEFGNDGIVRFGDAPPQEGMPPMSDHVKQMILHVELNIVGGHVLMGTDAPEDMGFHVTNGNNVYLNLEPDTREETTRLFQHLSEHGQIIHPLSDMFWGALYGSCQDQFGIHWMFNCTEK